MAKRKFAKEKEDKIIIDAAQGLVFSNEDELYQHFYKEISKLEKEFFALRSQDDLTEKEFLKFEENLNILLDDPDEVWKDLETIKGTEFNIYIRRIETLERGDNEVNLYHVAVVYLTENVPSFVYLHFPTISEELVMKYRRGEKVYDRVLHGKVRGAIEGDALYEGDELARGLYSAMLKVRSENDIKEVDFESFADFREESIEQPDEIWRSNDSLGNILVTFIKEYQDEEVGTFHYVVVTLEDMPSGSHALLFSFPTTDSSLVARYRHGENLQAEEVVQEASH
jgi:hypothetical protein